MLQFPNAPESHVASGVIHVTVGGQPRSMPTLKIGPFEDEWLPKYVGVVSGIFEGEEDRTVGEWIKVGVSTLLDAIVDYDKTGALGGRDYLRNNADHAELREIAHAIYERHFAPFMKDAQTILETVRRMTGQMAATTIAQRLQEKSSNGVSPTGDETPTSSE